MGQVMASGVFERVEKKYLLTKEKHDLLLADLKSHITTDKYGKYTICNIYYDTESYDLIRHSIEKPAYKEKLRLRSYGKPTKEDEVFLEIKKKYKGTVFKRRISLTLEEAQQYLNHGIKPDRDSQILREIDYFMNFYHPKPKLYLAYDRIAYFGSDDKQIRITFDQRIRSRQYDLNLAKGDYGEYLLDECSYLMEIKVPLAMPLWLANRLSSLEIYPTSFSKYGNIYKQKILSDREELECLQA